MGSRHEAPPLSSERSEASTGLTRRATEGRRGGGLGLDVRLLTPFPPTRGSDFRLTDAPPALLMPLSQGSEWPSPGHRAGSPPQQPNEPALARLSYPR